MSTNLILDRSNKNIQAAAASIVKAATELQALAQTSEAVTLQIEDLNAEAAALAAQNATARREAATELKLQVQEDRRNVLQQLLKADNLALISEADLTNIRSELAATKIKDDSELKTAVAQAVAAAKRDASAEALQVEAANRVSTAAKDATIEAQAGKIEFLTEQVADLRKQLDAERNTRLAIAQADAGKQGVIVNTGK